MYSLRSLYRIMLLVWFLLVLGMGCILAWNVGGGAGSGNLLAFFFPSSREPVSLPPLMPEKPKPVPPEPVKEAVVPPTSDWVALSRGNRAGKGTLSRPEVTVLDGGSVEVRFACSGEPGDFRDFLPDNVDARSVDLQGSWGRDLLVDKRLEKGVLKRLQIADHRQWLRISGIARNPSSRLAARVEYARSLHALRVVFSLETH